MANFDGSITLDNPNGIILKTGGSYCDKDIIITPRLEEKEITPNTSAQTVEPSTGSCGLKKVTIKKIPDDYVIPSGTQQITENGTYDVTTKKNVVVNIPSVVDISTEAEMDTLLVADNAGQYYKFTGTTTSKYINGDIYVVQI